ncbi:hypothetical protein QZH41_009014 [Actinostola sp. cb2023]|nr:hypothetical protein QZH41_009014 [Actinostola sp. cb2023]
MVSIGIRTSAFINHQPTDLSNSPIAMWMQQSGVAKRVCQRVESVEVYDSGISPRTAQVTMGRCRVHLERASAVPLTANQKVCPGMQACIPTMSEVIPLRTTNGIKDVTSAIDCTCAPPISGCQRHPWLRVFHRRTKYERVIDIGKCAGNCGNKRCQPLSIKKVAIKTPNGKLCTVFLWQLLTSLSYHRYFYRIGRKIVKVVEKCGCKSSCYRMSYKKAFQVVSGNGQNSNQSATKVIDIGICSRTSSCSGTIRGKCLYW